MLKLISLLISFSLVFTSLAPSYVQAAEVVRQQKAGATGVSNAVELALRQGLTPEAVEERLTVQAVKALRGLDKLFPESACAREMYKVQGREEIALGKGGTYPTFIYARACARLNYAAIKETTKGKNEVVAKVGYNAGGLTSDLAWLVSNYGANAKDRAAYFNYF
ncbi:hypothetical protein, partial [Candidatus Avelusimicrobium facis]|uniref:hypothetical protein n=2 Tax=Candidatus Avelusimicrobium facis TaxID=3416203 RepID=UPI0015B3C5DE